MRSVSNYWIYVARRPAPRAVVHVDTCHYVENRTQSLSPDRWWAHAFGSIEDAHSAARRMLPDRAQAVENCVHCIGVGPSG